MNYKKSLLSLAAVMALSNSVTADTTATYLPLSSTVADSMWVLFGVNGFSDGTASALGSTSGSFQAGFTELEDTTTNDELATEGLAAAAGSGNMGALQDVTKASTSLKVGMDMTGTVFDATEPLRTMYIKVNSSTPNVKFDYKASLEGKGMEILYDTVLYSVTINQNSTYAGAIDATSGGLNPATAGADRDDITEALDYNMSNNVANPVHYDYTIHQEDSTDVTVQTASMYHFNAVTQQWEVWNKNSPTNGNDFTTFEIGNAYWGRIDINNPTSNLINNAGGDAGLVLGNPTTLDGIPDPARYDDNNSVSKLTTGWNMLSFDKTKPDIRHASTGLHAVVNGVAAGGGFQITDSAGVNTVNVQISTANSENWAKQINADIETAKLNGTVPTSFNVKAFPADATDTALIFISDRKFSLLDANSTQPSDGVAPSTADVFAAVTTLTGADPYTSGLQGTAIADLNSTLQVTSAYGEYALMLDLMTGDLTGTNVAGGLDIAVGGGNAAVSAKVLFGNSTGDDTALALTGVADGNVTAATFATQILTATSDTFDGDDGTGRSLTVDTDYDGAVDKVIVSSTIPFYVKDNTFIRSFAVDTTSTGTTDITISNTASGAVTPDGSPTSTELATAINLLADDGASDTNVYAAVGNTATTLVVVATNNALFDLKDAASGLTSQDVLSSSSDTSDISKGAIGGAYSLDHVSALPVVQNEWLVTFTTGAQPDNVGDTMDVNLTVNGNVVTTTVTPSATSILTTAAGRKAWFDQLVTEMNTDINALNDVYAYATHDFDVTTDDFQNSKILVSGINVTAVAINRTGTAGAAEVLSPDAITDTFASTAGEFGTDLDDGNLAADVKTNAIFTPDFAIQGPLYTLRNSGSGYDVRAMIRATTDMNTTTGNVVFDSVDITRDEDDWFTNNEYNLFKIEHNAGYWVYLEDKAADALTISNVSLSASPHTYYFGNDTSFTTTNIINAGQISVEITGLDDTASSSGTDTAGSAYAIISGQEIQLKRTGTSNVFTGDISDYALASFAASSSPIEVTIRAVNGKGEAITEGTSTVPALSIDYTAPTTMAATDASTTGIALSATDENSVENFYIWHTYIPEVQTLRATSGTTAGTLVQTVAATANAATYEICSDFAFGTENTLRIVAADGLIDSSNLSNAIEYIYASTLKGAHVLYHKQDGTSLKSQIGVTYDSTCTQSAVLTDASDNNGVSLATLTTATESRISFIPDTLSNFTQDLAWTSNYALTGGGTAIIQIQSTSPYAGDNFYVEYGGNLYEGTFPSSEAAAAASISTTLGLVQVNSVGNASLAP